MFGSVPLPRDPHCQTPKKCSSPALIALTLADFESLQGRLRLQSRARRGVWPYSQPFGFGLNLLWFPVLKHRSQGIPHYGSSGLFHLGIFRVYTKVFLVLSFLMVTGVPHTHCVALQRFPSVAPLFFWLMFGMVPVLRDPPCQTPKIYPSPGLRAGTVADFEITGGIRGAGLTRTAWPYSDFRQ